MNENLVRAATFTAFREAVRFTAVKFDHRLKRPETPDEAMWRRFQEIERNHPATFQEHQRIALAVLTTAENFQ